MSFRGSAILSNTTSATTSILTVTPIGIQLNDLLLWAMCGGGGGTNTYTYPSGWARVPGVTKINVNSQATLDLFYKFATATEVAASTLTCTSNQNDFQSSHLRAYSARNSTAPYTAVNQIATATGNTQLTMANAGVTAAVADDIVVMGGTNNGNDPTFTVTPAAGFGNVSAAGWAASFATGVWGFDQVNSSGGATGTIAGVLNGGTAGDPVFYASFTVSLAQAFQGFPTWGLTA